MTYPVKVFSSDMAGAPTISDAPGTLIATLDACLINGFGLQTVDSITRAGSTATATINGGHLRKVDDIVLIAGANQSEYNGEAKITSVTSTTFSWEIAGTPSSPATGVISCKIAPVGRWSKEFTGTNLAAYRSTDIGATGHYFRIDDSMASAANTWAFLRGHTSMTNINTGVNAFPLSGQLTNGVAIRKTGILGAKKWVLIADGRFFYLFTEWSPAVYPGQYGVAFAGDIVSRRASDAYSSIVGGDSSTSITAPGSNQALWEASNYRYLSGTYYGVAGSFIPYLSFHEARRQIGLPNPVDNAMMFGGGPFLHEGNVLGSPVRGVFPGAYEGLANGSPGNGVRLKNVAGYTGRDLYVMTVPLNTSRFCYAFDVTGPWR